MRIPLVAQPADPHHTQSPRPFTAAPSPRRAPDDVVANSFNVYRAHLHLYGPAGAQLALAGRISDLEAARAALLAALPPRRRVLIEARAAAAAEGQGSDKWVMPAPILGEAAFRERERRHDAEEAARRARARGAGGGAG